MFDQAEKTPGKGGRGRVGSGQEKNQESSVKAKRRVLQEGRNDIRNLLTASLLVNSGEGDWEL